MNLIRIRDSWRLLIAVLIALAVVVVNSILLHAEPVTVQLSSGRTFTGEIDPRSTNDRLWLRCDRPQGAVYRPVDWERVERVRQGEQTWTAAEFRPQLDNFKSARAPVAVPPGELLPAPVPPSAPSVPSTRLQPELPSLARTVQIDAHLAHWGSYVDAPGLLLHVLPQDDYGRLVPVDATLEVDLTGELPSQFPIGREFQTLGRWVEALHVTDFGPDGAVVRLPFQAIDPVFDTNFAPQGIVHVRLSAAGHGVFEASTPATRIRPYNPIRDYLQVREGTRYFSNEWTSRGDR